jgi:hypothetical protein
VVEKSQEASHADDFADLRRQLKQVVKPGRPSETVGGIRAQHSCRRWESLSLTPSPPRRDPTPSFKLEGFLAARYDFATSLLHPDVHPPFPRRLLTRAQSLNPRHGRTQYHGCSLRVLLVVLPATKQNSHCCSLTMIRIVVTTRMRRSYWCLPYAGVARAVVRVTIFEEEL